ncbi:MAG: ROK family protein [Treponema sp.]|nr:ROK family protein [Treponema sp.]
MSTENAAHNNGPGVYDNAHSMCALGLDIGGTKTAVSLWRCPPSREMPAPDCAREGSLIKKAVFPTQGGPQKTLEKAAELIGELTEAAGVSSVSSLGISCGGPLDSRRGLILSPPNLPGWDEVPVTALLGEKTGLPCFLENDANACALAEWYWGAGRGCSDMAFLTFGTGLGCGLILGGRLYRGSGDLAGEVGHIRIAEDGPEGYGKRGSWEGYCSGGGISRMYAELTGRGETGKYVCDAAERGDAEALEVIKKSAFYLGRGLSLLIDILNVQRIVIGSVFARSESLFRTVMEKVIEEETLDAARKQCVILPAELGERLGDMAALGVAINGLEKTEKIL